jgi:hypothetical protein
VCSARFPVWRDFGSSPMLTVESSNFVMSVGEVESVWRRAESPEFDSRQGQNLLSPEVKRQGREADHSPLSRAEVKNGGAIPPLPHTSSRRGT